MQPAIPIIDLATSFTDELTTAHPTVTAIRDAAMYAGFFYVTNHRVPAALIENQFAHSEKLFALPLAEKQQFALVPQKSMRGYEALGTQQLEAGMERDLKESYQLGKHYDATDPYVVKHYAPYGENRWPTSLPGFQTQCLTYLEQMQRLSDHLLTLLALSLQLPTNYFQRFNTKPSDILRLLRYPPQPQNASKNLFGAGAHTDWGAITLLAQDSVGGLEVKLPSGNWVSAPPIANSFVINLGDMIPRWTNGKYQSNPHRVRNLNSHGRDRYSIVYFKDLDFEAVIEPIMETGETALFCPCTVRDHMNEMYRKSYGAL